MKKNNETKIVAVKLPKTVWDKLQVMAEKETIKTTQKYGLKTTVSGVVRDIILEKIK